MEQNNQFDTIKTENQRLCELPDNLRKLAIAITRNRLKSTPLGRDSDALDFKVAVLGTQISRMEDKFQEIECPYKTAALVIWEEREARRISSPEKAEFQRSSPDRLSEVFDNGIYSLL